ncbi:L-2-hydroxyglutarate oxidase [Alteribacillus iranensis]|uniref:L-2-hydroxyglutarate oxidase n=1 Tax=Alteribacillus iranensis TaxID=930128 RepID=A0A1I2CT66_9BACI|nr:L-2-hydroxyglutarate oxidase [Alteribacillus iranensis]SFE71537.1 L-2-hydroxyglutarate oxidase [Alteribacillus iranensis]
MYDYTIVGAGIVGLSVAHAILKHEPNASVAIIEKERKVASHQTGNNSGVIHSGIYYRPGSFKARFAREGNQSMVEFCEEHGIDYDQCGKVIVATNQSQVPALKKLYERGQENELEVHWMEKEEVLEREPHVNAVAAVEVPSTGIVDYKQVSEKLASLSQEKGADLFLNEEVVSINERQGVTIETNNRTIETRIMINCAGLHSDRVAEMTGYKLDMQIVPFRGEYYELKDSAKHLVKDLIYPVPNPDFPFLGVHFTRMIDGGVEAGPNAVLGFKREGYTKTDISFRDLSQVLKSFGFWKLASANMKEGLAEMKRSFSKKAFLTSLQEIIPEIQEDDLVPAPAGVRAQAMRSNGELVDDFYIVAGRHSFHVCNAPSPAATSALQIGEEVFRQMSEKELKV